MEVVILANAPEALIELCGVSLLERILRILARQHFTGATIISTTPEEIRVATEPPSWARASLITRVVRRDKFQAGGRMLFLPANIYCDARLIRALAEHDGEGALVDSDFIPGAAVIDDGDFEAVPARVREGRIAIIDAAHVPSYVIGMRRELKPRCFAVLPNDRKAMRLVLDTGQPRSLDLPGIIQSPIETFIMRWLCRTSITPNQITAFGVLVSLGATGLFAGGHLWYGMIPALAIGVIDGLDGKQARIKIETTEAGEWEHTVDYLTEASWWAALAVYFQRSGQLPNAWLWFGVIMAADAIDRLAKRAAKKRIGRLLDDYSPFDRFVRLIGARRDVYLWTLGIGLALGVAASTYRLCAIWGMITAGVHVLRAGMILAGRRITPH